MTSAEVLGWEPQVVKSDLGKRIKKTEDQVNVLLKQVDPKEKRDSDHTIANLMAISKSYLNQIYLYFLLNRVDLESRSLKNEEVLVGARKSIAALLAQWEKFTGMDFDDMYRVHPLIQGNLKNHDVFQVFQLIGFSIDSFDLYFLEDRRWQASLLPLRKRFLICFCNALDFKTLLKEKDPEYENYIENNEIYEVLKQSFDITVQAYWNQNVKSEEFNIAEMSKALSLVQFFRNLTSVFEDRETHANYKKRFNVWKKYIDEKSEEQKKTSADSKRGFFSLRSK